MLVVYCVYINLIVVFTAVLCNNPGVPTHGSRSGDDFTFGKTVSYQCDPGHKITGSSSRTCTASGTWSGIEPTCTGKQYILNPGNISIVIFDQGQLYC